MALASVFLEGSWNDFAALLENRPAACAPVEMGQEGCRAADLSVSEGTGGREDGSQAAHVLICGRAVSVKAVEPTLFVLSLDFTQTRRQ